MIEPQSSLRSATLFGGEAISEVQRLSAAIFGGRHLHTLSFPNILIGNLKPAKVLSAQTVPA